MGKNLGNSTHQDVRKIPNEFRYCSKVFPTASSKNMDYTKSKMENQDTTDNMRNFEWMQGLPMYKICRTDSRTESTNAALPLSFYFESLDTDGVATASSPRRNLGSFQLQKNVNKTNA